MTNRLRCAPTGYFTGGGALCYSESGAEAGYMTIRGAQASRIP